MYVHMGTLVVQRRVRYRGIWLVNCASPQGLFNAYVHSNCTGTSEAVSIEDKGSVACIMSCATEQCSVVPQGKCNTCLQNCTFSARMLWPTLATVAFEGQHSRRCIAEPVQS